MSNIPPFARKFALDFIETFLGLVIVLNVAIPGNLDEAKAIAVLIVGAVGSAAVSAGRRAFPAAKAYLMERLTEATFPDVDDLSTESYDVETNLDGDIIVKP